jgi:Arc/MetJ-type ribon-helix-helix transcriptional regulator
MERKVRSTIITVRIPNGLLERIDEDVNRSNEFSSRADYILDALRKYEEHRTKLLAERATAKATQPEEDFISSSQRSVDSVRDEK